MTFQWLPALQCQGSSQNGSPRGPEFFRTLSRNRAAARHHLSPTLPVAHSHACLQRSHLFSEDEQLQTKYSPRTQSKPPQTSRKTISCCVVTEPLLTEDAGMLPASPIRLSIRTHSADSHGCVLREPVPEFPECSRKGLSWGQKACSALTLLWNQVVLGFAG